MLMQESEVSGWFGSSGILVNKDGQNGDGTSQLEAS